jgi:hypothetical protein
LIRGAPFQDQQRSEKRKLQMVSLQEPSPQAVIQTLSKTVKASNFAPNTKQLCPQIQRFETNLF